MRYLDIIKKNKELGSFLANTKKYKIAVLSNTTVHQLKEILEYEIRSQSIYAEISFGDYNNIVQDSFKFQDADLIIVFYELANLVDGFQYLSESFKDNKKSDFIEKQKKEIKLILHNFKKTPAIIFNLFSSATFNSFTLKTNVLDEISNRLNSFLISTKTNNLHLIDLNKIFFQLSGSQSIDFRQYYHSKSLYSLDFYKAYSKFILPIPLFLNGKTKKALIFDCDNTLWGGIVGEDGIENLRISAKDPEGEIYQEVQHLSKNISKQGVILALCSKNNAEDVEKVLMERTDMVLKKDDFSIMKINWEDKLTSITSIAQELNIGLNSIVFVDDSDFEINYIKQQLPEVHCIQVPKNKSSYPNILRRNLDLFFHTGLTQEDKTRKLMYREQEHRKMEKEKFSKLTDYLDSLEIEVETFVNTSSIIPRMAQMTQKTNQFNLCTKRYSEAEIHDFVQKKNYITIAISVIDKYGESGISGLCLLKIDSEKKEAEINNFLLSCRIIGRNIEFVLFNELINTLKNNKITKLSASYVKTDKNQQVVDFYQKTGMKIETKDAFKTNYSLSVKDFQKIITPAIKITKHGK
jgi:FkbH-like protein